MTESGPTAALDTPHLHPRWGAVVEELLHHTSRYYAYAEAWLRHLTGAEDFALVGYHAERLRPELRRLMVAIMIEPPSARAGQDLLALIDAQRGGGAPELGTDYAARLAALPHDDHLHYDHIWREHPLPPATPAPDPFINLCERLQIPVAVEGAHVHVSTHQLAQQLDGPEAQIRENLLEAITWLHDAGYRLRNHPGFTHEAARGLHGAA